MGTMNATRKTINKLDVDRNELKKGKTDGKTKERVEGWRKNINTLTNDIKAQSTLLDELDSGE